MTPLYRDFNVELIEAIGPKGARQAWLTSKPTLKYDTEEQIQADLKKVIELDLPITGFHTYTLKIGSSILFRDLMLSMRPIQVWATSSRIVKLENLGLERKITPTSSRVLSDYTEVVEAQSAGEALDITKRLCPLQQYTEFCIVIDLRTLVVFCKTVRYCDRELFRSHCLPILNCIGLDEKGLGEIRSNHIYNKLSIPDSKISLISMLNSRGQVDYKELDLSYELGVKVAFALGAQFLRQHYARVRSSCWNELKEIGYNQMLDQYNSSDEFYYVSTAEKEEWQQVCSRRTCWVAQFDWSDKFGWDYIIGNWVNGLTSKEFRKNLPCKGCGKACNIFNETKLRLFSNRSDYNQFTDNVPDENPPCPLLVEDKGMVNLRESMYKSNSTIFQKWKSLVEEELVDNPNNKARQFYYGEINECPEDTSYLK